MHLLILWFIQLYRRFIPAEKRRRCLFHESCSAYVERMARDFGAWAALRAFVRRFRCCRPGYGFEWNTPSETWFLVCADGSKIPAPQVAQHLVAEYQLLKAHLT
ncbi:MAG: membrane protein insertion efficiency factor YidD [candidate division KSB1 bacterium]